jgi:protein-S-isoprenylcysteine O-methyltransferase Ste14
MLAGIVADRLAPAVVFGALAIASGSRAVTAVARSPSEPTLLAGLVQGLDIVHHLLTFLFCSLVAALFLVRRAPQGSRAQPLAMAVALAGTVVMSAVVVQPVTTQDWRVLALADVLLALGLLISIYAAASLRDCFGVAPEARGLVTTAAYRFARHPLYLGEGIAALGLLLPVLAPPATLIFSIFCLCQLTRARLEERALAAAFPEYAAYRSRTPALLPRLCR